MSKIKIPYAVMSFAELREDDFYYVDKTHYIAELENYKNPIFLRPRRFGKSLMCSTLQYYYDINQSNRFEELFGGTWIGNNPTPSQGKYLVLSLDFSKVHADVESTDELAEEFNNIILPTLKEFINSTYFNYFEGFEIPENISAWNILGNIITHIKSRKLPQLYIIIDEYDNFTNRLITSHRDELYSNVLSKDGFLNTFFRNIKSGEQSEAVAGTFITGVLPITVDDLTSGFNVGEVITLKPQFLSMLGFTHSEAKLYLETIFDVNGYDRSMLNEVWQIIVNNYDGYRFLPNAEPIFNSTILTYFLKDFSLNNGTIPDELIDENVRTDIGWITRLAEGQENAIEMLENVLSTGILEYSRSSLTSRFNKIKFTSKEFLPISLFYLGMTTIVDDFDMQLPNNTIKSIFTDYYSQLTNLGRQDDVYVPYFRQFAKDHNFDGLFECYFKNYLGQFVAQSFDKVNETFVRNTFYELCNRYLRATFILGMEQNYPSGRSNFEITGRPGTAYHYNKHIVEIKYLTVDQWEKVKKQEQPKQEHLDQLDAYAKDAKELLPLFTIHKHIAYICANKGWRHWKL